MRRFDAACALSRLARAAVCVGALVGPFAGVAQAAPPNDEPAGAIPIRVTWTNPVSPEFVQAVPVAEWGSASGYADVQPSCTGAGSSDHSQWWSVSVPEAGTLKLIVSTSNVAAFTPVITLYDATQGEVGCATTDGSIKANPAQVTLSAYVFPLSETAPQTYLVRVAEVLTNQQQTNRAPYDLAVQGHDLTPPRIVVTMPKDVPEVKDTVTYDAEGTTDASGLDQLSKIWTFKDGLRPVTTRAGDTATYTWMTPGLHKVTYTVKDLAGNGTTYTFFVFVHDWTPPRIRDFGVKSVPFPGGRSITILVKHEEPVTMHLTITQGRRLLYRGNMRLLKGTKAHRRILLRAKVGRTPWIRIVGSAKDSAGNVTVLPGCHLDPVKGTGHCFKP